jgi:hypothetical protein
VGNSLAPAKKKNENMRKSQMLSHASSIVANDELTCIKECTQKEEEEKKKDLKIVILFFPNV